MSLQYHESELRIALDPTHPDHILPPPLPLSAKVLDVGCGAGQTLIAAYPDRVCFGLDIDLEAISFGRTLTSDVSFVNGRAEALPFKNQEFDVVIARVSLPYTNLGSSLKEIRRVLRDDGKLWLTLHAFSMAWKQSQENGFRAKIFFGYILLNSFWFHLASKQFPFLGGKYESFQTERGIRRALEQNDFREVTITRTRHFVVEALAGGGGPLGASDSVSNPLTHEVKLKAVASARAVPKPLF
jgi:ubiquinone/menaquinone biosynthesis C-methylase UbiE